ncbi:MAG: AI-2E family transporter [Candidatus Nanopelagicales bacterium]|jgi:predicted PurR-regulated permease PerM|nr:AI-2E family transporter [Candidatus Nanopelagicales bacterium]MDP4824900.1 AI-2E family transporter [Candidatus Nanopelagicales bacterium]
MANPREITVSSSTLWRVGFIALAVIAIGLLIQFFIEDGGGVIFIVLMAWFFALAMSPAVDLLARRMRRGFATLIVMGGVAGFIALFLAAFGALLVDQLVQIVRSIPDLFARAVEWVNSTFDTAYDPKALLAQIDITDAAVRTFATDIASGIFSIATSVLGSIFGLFTFGLIAFYLSADGPRLRRYIASLFPARSQAVLLNVWDVTAEKTGRYVAARAILATVNGVTSGIVFFAVGLPYWLPMAIWTGVVAQFVPMVGTYIAIILPVIIGLLSGNPWIGVIVLAWALLYQQVENLTIEPRISARAVNVNPAVAFISVLLGAALFGVAGALLAIPVTAMVLTLVGIYVKRHELIEELHQESAPGEHGEDALSPPLE